MKVFKFSLDKSSKKFRCPSCELKRMVRYVDIETSEYVEDIFGRCDRETSCGYHKKPDSKESLVNLNTVQNTKVIPDYISPDFVHQSLKKYDENNIVKFLFQHFPKDKVENCIAKYQIGTSKLWKGATVFWQINNTGKVCTGKIMLFEESTCKRVKQPYSHISWVHKKIGGQNYQLKQCLYGLHLINYNTAKDNCNTVGIVESEKTAIVMSLFLPNTVWMATGSKANFKLELLKPLKNKKIIVYPDKGEYTDWNCKTLELQKLGFNVKCSSIVEDTNYDVGTDLADVYFYLENNKTTKIILSDAEKKIAEIAKINPTIIDLIKAFDLIDDKGNGIRLFEKNDYIAPI
jgi:hypothetical protein